MLICLPIMVVDIVGSEDIKSPLRLQVIVRGMSPLLMRHVSWATLPWSIVSNPNEKGTILGFSVNKTFSVPDCIYHWQRALLSTMLFQLGSQLYRCTLHCVDSQQLISSACLSADQSLLWSTLDQSLSCPPWDSRSGTRVYLPFVHYMWAGQNLPDW